jgi:hypothetical protein
MSEREIYIDAELEPRRPRPRPPLVGTPPPPVGQRPRCPGCDRELRPYLRDLHEEQPDDSADLLHPTGRQWTGGYHGYLDFCGSTCAARYAVRVVRIVLPALPKSMQGPIRNALIRRPE